MARSRKVALLGGGVIGAGWAGRLLVNGIDVAVYDPGEVEVSVRSSLDHAIRAYRKLTLVPVDLKGSITFTRDLAEALDGAEFVQESAPERMDVKLPLLKEANRLAGAGVVIASSSSGLLPSELQKDCPHPERICIGHPFNPVYLLPLVEIVGGKQTTDETKHLAAEFYAGIGMHPLTIRKEIEAFVSDRILESVWREVLHLVRDGVVTADEADQAILYGPGLRWAFMGMFLTYRLGGGKEGMKHFLEQFGPTLRLPWARFDGPELDAGLIDTITRQSDEQAAGRSIEDLTCQRDDCIVAVLQGLRGVNCGAGEVYRRYEELLYEVSHREESDDQDDGSAPLRLYRSSVQPEWIDYNGHMTESRYLQVFSDGTDALLLHLGLDGAYHDRGFSYYTAETHICHLNEGKVGDKIHVVTQILGSDEKRIHLLHAIHRTADDAVLATAEMLLLHVDTGRGKVVPAEPGVLTRLEQLASAHAGLACPSQAGRAISLRGRSAS